MSNANPTYREALEALVREVKRKLSTGAYDDEGGLWELNNSIEMVNAEGALGFDI